jgi:hypothetical protein
MADREDGVSRWLRLGGIVVAIVILLIVVMVVMVGLGGHTPPVEH